MHKSLISKLITGAAVLFTALSASVQATPVDDHGALTTKGAYILDKNGQVVQLRGMSFYWSTGGWIGASWYSAGNLDVLVDKYKCTVVRVAFDGKDNWAKCEEVVKEAIKKGIYVILDWHSHNAENEESAAISFFETQATNYKNTPNVIFEPYNEPITSNGDKTDGTSATATATWKKIKPYLQKVTTAIRAKGAQNLIIAGTPYYCQYVQCPAGDPLTGTNIAYAFHFYAASHGPEAYFVKNGNGTGGEEGNLLTAGLGKIPIFITEWGTTHSDGGQKCDATNTKWWFDTYINGKFHLSHCNWSVSGGETSSAFSGSVSSLSESGNIVMPFIQNGGVDAFNPPWVEGDIGPAKDTAFTMPGTHQTSRFNRFYGGIIQKSKVAFSLKDKVDKRNGDDTCVAIGAGGNGTEWVSYYFNSSSATKNILVRYRTEGAASAEAFVNSKSVGTMEFKKVADWDYLLLAANASTGKDTLKLGIKSVTSTLYIEWIEFTNNGIPTITTLMMPKNERIRDVSVAAFKDGFSATLSSKHDFTSFSLVGVDGRSIRNEKISRNSTSVLCNKIPNGTWFVKLNGINGNRIFKVIVNN